MATLTNCPSCNRQLRVPDELIGRQVKCAQCGTMFTVSGAGAQVAAATPDAYEDVGAGSGRRAADLVRGPAICLLITAILNFLLGLLFVSWGVEVINADPNEIAKAQKEAKERFEKQGGKQGDNPFDDPDFIKGMVSGFGLGFLLFGGLSAVGAVLTIAGAVQMMRLRSLGLARTASVVVMIPFITSPCCLLGLPFGIWSLIVLNKPDVSAAFRTSAMS